MSMIKRSGVPKGESVKVIASCQNCGFVEPDQESYLFCPKCNFVMGIVNNKCVDGTCSLVKKDVKNNNR